MTSSERSITVVLSTHNQKDTLIKCLRSLEAQDYRNYKLLLILDSCDDGSKEIAEKFIDRNTNFEMEVSDQDLYISKSRNMGIEFSDSEITAFLDGDSIPLKDWLKSIDSSFEKDISLVMGPSQLPNLDDKRNRYRAMKYVLKSGKYHRDNKALFDMSNWRDMPLVSGRNMAFRTEYLKKNGFDESLVEKGCEDIQKQFNLVFSGGTVMFNPDMVARHEHPHSLKQHFSKAISYGRGEIQLFKDFGKDIMENKYCQSYFPYRLKNMFKKHNEKRFGFEQLVMEVSDFIGRKIGNYTERFYRVINNLKDNSWYR